MRCLLAVTFVATLILPAVGHAQEPQPSKPDDRLILSAGLGRIDCRRGDGSVAEFVPPGSGTHGDIRAIVGAGLRVRVGGRLLQLEARELRGSLSVVSLGTAPHF